MTLALTDIIEADLLATLDGEIEPQAVLDRYAGSKGPLYAALARATPQATERFAALRDRWVKTQAKVRDSEKAAAEAEARARKDGRRAATAEKRLKQATDALTAQQHLLDRAKLLRDAGLDDDSLAALTRVFAQVATTASIPPAEAVARFLKAATNFEDIAAFERQAADAKARAKKAEADAQQRERNAGVREVAIAWAEWFVRRRITAEAVSAWKAVGEKLGLTAENLAQALAGALKQFGTLEAACEAKTKERDGLAREIDQKRAIIAKLKAESENITAALDAVAHHGSSQVASARAAAVAAVHAVRDETLTTLRETEQQYAQIKAEAAALEPAVRFAQALCNRQEMLWLEVTADQWVALLRHFGRYLATRDQAEAPPPEHVSKQLKDRISYPTLYGQPRLTELVDWVVLGLYRPIRSHANSAEGVRRYLGDGRR